MIAARQIAFGKAAGAKKPYDAEIEYLESTGTQWIDTGIVPDTSTVWRLTCAATNTSTQFIGAIDSATHRFHFSLYDSEKVRGCMGMIQTDIGSPDLAFHVLYLNAANKTVGLDGTSLPCNHDSTLPDISIWLFGRNSDHPLYKRMISIKISASQILQNDVFVRDLIPVRKGNIGYMYDRVSGQLFGNQGTGEFVLGPDIIDYTAKDYIQDGLVAMWDGIENAGWGTHDPSATTWKDLVGGITPAPSTNELTWGNNYIDLSKDKYLTFESLDILNVYNTKKLTLEFVVQPPESQVNIGVLTPHEYNLFPGWFGSSSWVTYKSFGYTKESRVEIISERNSFSTVVDAQTTWYLNGASSISGGTGTQNVTVPQFYIGRLGSFAGYLDGRCYSIRLYSRALTAEEIAHNYEIDKARFGL